jgi:hypothetical protein
VYSGVRPPHGGSPRRGLPNLTPHILPSLAFPVIPSDMTAAILFDFNGVIIDDEPQHCDALVTGHGPAELPWAHA